VRRCFIIACWRQSASMSDNKRNKNLHSTTDLCKVGFSFTPAHFIHLHFFSYLQRMF